MSLYFALYAVENNKNKKSVKFPGDTLNFRDFIQVFVFTANHHLTQSSYRYKIQWNFNGSNIFGTMKICSKQKSAKKTEADITQTLKEIISQTD